MSPHDRISLILIGIGVCVAVLLAWVHSNEQAWQAEQARVAARRARRRSFPPFDAARSAGPGGVLPLADMRSTEPAITPHRLVRPFVTHPIPVVVVPATVPTALPNCRVCRDGAEVVGARCFLCGTPAPVNGVTLP